jgi:hypothetical protein
MDITVGADVQQVGVLAFAGRAAGVCHEFREGDPLRVEGAFSLWHSRGRHDATRP